MPRYSALITQLHSVYVEYDAPDDCTALYLANFWSDTNESVEERVYSIGRIDERWPDGETKFRMKTNCVLEAPVVNNVAEPDSSDESGKRDRVVYRKDEPRQSPTAVGLIEEERVLAKFGSNVKLRTDRKEEGDSR